MLWQTPLHSPFLLPMHQMLHKEELLLLTCPPSPAHAKLMLEGYSERHRLTPSSPWLGSWGPWLEFSSGVGWHLKFAGRVQMTVRGFQDPLRSFNRLLKGCLSRFKDTVRACGQTTRGKVSGFLMQSHSSTDVQVVATLQDMQQCKDTDRHGPDQCRFLNGTLSVLASNSEC